MVSKSIFMLSFVLVFNLSCQTANKHNTTIRDANKTKCEYVIHQLNEGLLLEEIDYFIKQNELKYRGRSKFIGIQKKKDENNTIYSIRYEFNFDNQILKKTKLVSYARSTFVFFATNEKLKPKDRIKECGLLEIGERLFPKSYQNYIKHGVWPFITNHGVTVHELIVKNDSLISKRVYID